MARLHNQTKAQQSINRKTYDLNREQVNTIGKYTNDRTEPYVTTNRSTMNEFEIKQQESSAYPL